MTPDPPVLDYAPPPSPHKRPAVPWPIVYLAGVAASLAYCCVDPFSLEKLPHRNGDAFTFLAPYLCVQIATIVLVARRPALGKRKWSLFALGLLSPHVPFLIAYALAWLSGVRPWGWG